MSDFISPPFFGGPKLTRKQFLGQITLSQTSTGASSCQRLRDSALVGPHLGPAALTEGQASDFAYSYQTIGAGEPATADDLNPAADAAIAIAQGVVSDAQADVGAKDSAQTLALRDLKDALEAEALARQVAYRAGHAVSILTARLAHKPPTATDDELAAAVVAATAARVDVNATLLEREEKETAAATAASDLRLAENALHEAKRGLQYRQQYKDGIDFVCTLANQTHLNYQGTHPPDGIATAYEILEVWSGGHESYLDYGVYHHPTGANPDDPVVYEAFFQSATYRHVFSLSDDAYQQFLASGKTLKLRWCEVTKNFPKVDHSITTYPPYEYSSPGAESDDLSYTTHQETFSASAAILDVDGTWLFTGEAHALPAPATTEVKPGAIPTAFTTTVQGLPYVPMVEIVAQEFRGAERWRQGWPAFVTDPGGITPRYLTMTASNAPGAPAAIDYGGSLQLELPPYETDEPDWLIPNGCDRSFAPLIIQDYLNAQTRDDAANATLFSAPQPFYPVAGELAEEGPGARQPYGPDDDATVLSPTSRHMNKPPFLVWTLHNAQTPAMIHEEVAGFAAQAWHNVEGDAYPAVIPGLQRAINYLSPDGDYAAAQTLRYRLSFSARDARSGDDSYEVTYRWGLRRRDLVSGVTTTEVQTKTVTYPITEAEGLTLLDWREVSAGPQESVEVVVLRGINSDPHSFWPCEGVLAPHFAGEGNPALEPRMWSFTDDPPDDEEGGGGGGGGPTPV